MRPHPLPSPLPPTSVSADAFVRRSFGFSWMAIIFHGPLDGRSQVLTAASAAGVARCRRCNVVSQSVWLFLSSPLLSPVLLLLFSLLWPMKLWLIREGRRRWLREGRKKGRKEGRERERERERESPNVIFLRNIERGSDSESPRAILQQPHRI